MATHRPLVFVRTRSGCFECVSHSGPRGRGHGVSGRPTITHDGHTQYAYRLVYEWLKGPIPKGFVPDHLCRNPRCCEVLHLEPVTNAVNIRRAWNGTKDDNGDCRIHGPALMRKSGRVPRCAACTAIKKRKTRKSRPGRRTLFFHDPDLLGAYRKAGSQ
jgi:hypothetical protein